MGMQISSGKQKKGAQPNINVTPLVDVVLVLLIIFMVVLPNVQEGVTINMFESKSAKKQQVQDDAIILSLTKDGYVYIADEVLAKSDAIARLKKAREKDPEVQILLRADSKLEYENVREWFKLAQDMGIGKIDLAVQVKKGSS